MSLCGLGVVAIWHDLLPQAKEEFYEWHNREHMPERAGIPGFRRGRRYVALEGTPEYFNLYEADSAQVLAGVDYLARLNAPTRWTREVVASFRDVSRSICRVVYSAGTGQGGVMSTQRFDVPPARRNEAITFLSQRCLPALVALPGVAGVHLCLADEDISNLETEEKKARADRTSVPTWILLIEGVSGPHVQAASAAAAEALQEQTFCGSILASTYQLEHSRCKLPWSEG